LGLIDAEFIQFSFAQPSPLKVPHMGWNTLTVVRDNPLIDAGESEQRFYFVHSYYARCTHEEDVIATSDYGGPFVAAYGHDHIFGVQFHPEKSHKFGMRLLQNFVAFVC
jgi:glutamine amidotransferase